MDKNLIKNYVSQQFDNTSFENAQELFNWCIEDLNLNNIEKQEFLNECENFFNEILVK